MATFELKVPKLGESVEEATITKWFVKENDWVTDDQPLLEVATDKVDSEIPSPVEGKVIKILFAENTKLAVGTIIALIETGDKANNVIDTNTNTKTDTITTIEKNDVKENVHLSSANATRFYSPLVKSIAKINNISITELETITGTGKNNRVTKDDVLDYFNKKSKLPIITTSISDKPTKTNIVPDIKKPVVLAANGDEIVEMDRMRKIIADHMVMSKHVSAHVTNVVEVDVTNLVIWRNKVKNEFEKHEGTKLTFMPVFIEVIAKALKEYPVVNASVNDTQIILRKAINIGFAVALPTGNLIVPVIKNTDKLNLAGIATEMNRLADTARKNKLAPDDIQGGTFTITNFGSFRNIIGTPVINQPQVAILATGMIQKKPVVLETPTGDVIAIRHMMYLSMSYDHRIIDGAMGGGFLRRVGDLLEQYVN